MTPPEIKQRSEADRLFGEIAVRLFMTTRRNVTKALKAQAHARGEGGTPSVGEVMVALEMLSERQVRAILKAQEVYDEQTVETLYGRIAIKNGFITQSDLEAALKIQNRVSRRLRIGEILVKKSFMTWDQHEAILATQERILAEIKRKKEESGRIEITDENDLKATVGAPAERPSLVDPSKQG
ncbi:MAG: hypothetical protein JKY65_12515 [Planctomycetes bacterium]|nr:hypothetical protein [Planctomycetota bacterium]